MTHRFGRNRPATPNPHPQLAKYRATSEARKFPDSCDYMAAAMPVLTMMHANGPDPDYPAAPGGLGDCTIAACANATGVWTGNSGRLVITPTSDVVAMYSRCSGYIPGNDATDQGCDELVVLNEWKTVGLGGRTIDGAVAVNAGDAAELAWAIYVFGCVVLCGEMPWGWTPVSGPGFVWGVDGDPIPSRGHCWISAAYDRNGIMPVTWALASEKTPSYETWPAAAHYNEPIAGGSCYAPISRDWLNARGVAPNGYDLDTMVKDASAMGVIL